MNIFILCANVNNGFYKEPLKAKLKKADGKLTNMHKAIEKDILQKPRKKLHEICTKFAVLMYFFLQFLYAIMVVA